MRIAILAAVTLASSGAYADDTVSHAPIENDASTVRVHIDDPTVVLTQRGHTICVAPCDLDVPREGKYVIKDDGHKTKPLTLPESGQVANIHVTRETRSRATAGGIVLGVTLPVSLLLGIAAAATANQSCSGWFCINPAPLFGVASAMVGGAGLITGIILVSTTKTIMTAEVSGQATAQQKRPAWTPTFDVNTHGASVGLGATF